MSLFHSKPKGAIPLIVIIIGFIAIVAGGSLVLTQQMSKKVNSWFNLLPSFSNKSQEITSKTETETSKSFIPSESSELSFDQSQINNINNIIEQIIKQIGSNSNKWLIKIFRYIMNWSITYMESNPEKWFDEDQKGKDQLQHVNIPLVKQALENFRHRFNQILNQIESNPQKWANENQGKKNQLDQALDSLIKEISEAFQYQPQIDQIIEQMKSNSLKWLTTTDKAIKDQLHQANVSLAKQLEALTHSQITYDEHTGYWYKDGVILYEVPKVGRASFRTYPVSGAKVYVDNEYKGITPLDVTLTVGEHTLKFKKDNYQEYITNFQVKENTPVVITHKLIK